MIYRVNSYDIGEGCSVQDEENGPQYLALRYMSCDGEEDELLTEVDWYLSERYDWNYWSAVDWVPNTDFRRERRIWWSVVSESAERSNKRRTDHCPERREYHLQHVTKRYLCCVLLDRLIERDCWSCFLGDRREVCEERLFQGFWTEMEGYKCDGSFSKGLCQVVAFSNEVWRWLSSDHVVQCQWWEMCR